MSPRFRKPLVVLVCLLTTAVPRAGEAADTAVNFDGVNDYVQISGAGNLLYVTKSSFSFCAWAKPQDIPPTSCSTNNNTCVYAVLARPGYHLNIGYTSSGRFHAEIWSGNNVWSGLSSAPFPPGAWHHLCLAVDDAAKQMRFYVDGAPVAGSPRSYTGTLYQYWTNPYYIGVGRPTSDWRWHFKGAIDEVRVYNRALSAAEVSSQYNGGKGQYGTAGAGLVGGWHLDEGTSNSAADYSGNGNTGTLINGPTWAPSGVALRPAPTWPLTLEAETMPTKTTGGAVSGGWNIWGNGYIEEPVSFPTTGTYQFQVVARGDYAGGAWPQMEVRVDQQPIASVTVNTSTWNTFTIQKPVAAGSRRVAIAFTNDYYSPPADRNLIVDKVILSSLTADTTAPTVSLTAPAAGATVSGTAVAVRANASDTVGVAGVQFKLDGANLGAEDTTGPDYSITWDTTKATNGSHTLTAVARDAAGLSTTSSPISVTVSNAPADTTPPTGSVTINSGAAATNTAAVTLALSATDDPGTVSQMQFSNDGTTYSTPEAYATTTAWTLTAGDGTKTVYAKFKDAAGNWSSAASDTIVLDATPPAISAVSASNVAKTTATITWTTDEPATSQVEYGLTTSYGQTTPLDSTLGTPHGVSLSGLTAGAQYQYRVHSKDALGNERVSGNFTFTTTAVDTTPPTIEFLSPKDGEVILAP